MVHTSIVHNVRWCHLLEMGLEGLGWGGGGGGLPFLHCEDEQLSRAMGDLRANHSTTTGH